MGKRSRAEIHIGGKVPARLVDKLAKLINQNDLRDDWGGSRISENCPLKEYAVDLDGKPIPLILYHEEADWGEFIDLEIFSATTTSVSTGSAEAGKAFTGLVESDSGLACQKPMVTISLTHQAQKILEK
jgi:hypothetical protein